MTTEHYCRATMAPIDPRKLRPGYDCRCSGCMAWLREQKERGNVA